MTTVGVVDPGIRGCGVALFHEVAALNPGCLLAATYVSNPVPFGNDPEACLGMVNAVVRWFARVSPYVPIWQPDLLLVEWPRIYSAGKQDGKDPNDLLPLTAVDIGVAAALGCKCKRYYPDEWKQQTPKEVMNARVEQRLAPNERARIVRVGALDHNTLDAVGIGLHHLGRLQRKRVIAR